MQIDMQQNRIKMNKYNFIQIFSFFIINLPITKNKYLHRFCQKI